MNGRSDIASESVGPTIVAGEILVEIMATELGHGFLEPLQLMGPYPSGAPAIFIDQVAKLGGGAAIVACVGRDDFGTINLERLKGDGVDISAVSVSERYPTGSAFVRYRPDGGRDFVYNIAESAAGQIGLTPEARQLADKAGHLHVMGSTLSVSGLKEIVAYSVKAVRSRGGSTSFDPNVRKELIDLDGGLFAALVDDADLLLPSGDELLAAAGVESEREAVAALIARGVGEIVLKRGAAGSTRFGADGSRIDCRGFLVQEVDPTGAGDCFGATYLTCRRKGMAPDRALLYANAAGALNVTRRGPMEGLAGFDALDRFIAGADRAK
ncbi:sugar kinase [Mesorhizobium sp. CU2]|uniref:tagatose kinase n=1 Tax=unclassified Mesorhizobium TaxID=325217 RepID=UPI00112606DC|nr:MULTISPECIES: sugar kinase [unclassified Mesorhizobium]TPN76692.1 sugar kinase [Mesorhizobium sp. CU3]TPO15535.1 sugar kinase [Mesorhizobium sp. CU2]